MSRLLLGTTIGFANVVLLVPAQAVAQVTTATDVTQDDPRLRHLPEHPAGPGQGADGGLGESAHLSSVRYEQFAERLTRGALESQRLLEPLLPALPAGTRDAPAAHADDLPGSASRSSRSAATASGWWRIRPCWAGPSARAPSVRWSRASKASIAARAWRTPSGIAARTACHAAVKANDRLTREKMTYILEELRRTAYSTVCPHGRPALLRLTRQDLERPFERM